MCDVVLKTALCAALCEVCSAQVVRPLVMHGLGLIRAHRRITPAPGVISLNCVLDNGCVHLHYLYNTPSGGDGGPVRVPRHEDEMSAQVEILEVRPA